MSLPLCAHCGDRPATTAAVRKTFASNHRLVRLCACCATIQDRAPRQPPIPLPEPELRVTHRPMTPEEAARRWERNFTDIAPGADACTYLSSSYTLHKGLLGGLEEDHVNERGRHKR